MRLRILFFIALISFSVLILGLWNIQINKHNYYKHLADKNRVRLVPLPAARGSIYDRKGRVLAEDKARFTLTVIPDEFFRQESVKISEILERLSMILGFSSSQIKQRINAPKTSPFSPLTIFKNLDKNKIAAIEESNLDLSTLSIQVVPQRNYSYGKIISHIIGYVSKMNLEEVRQRKKYGYQPQDWIGRTGIERSANNYLMGESGGRQFEVNHLGRKVQELGVQLPRRGENVYLNIDIDLQKAAYHLLARENLKGTIIIIQPYSGEILTMVSHPGFDPNDFVRGNRKKIDKILQSRHSPLLNRAIAGLYSPGSIFKPIVAIAGLETKTILSNSHFYCSGKYLIGDRFFYCWKKSGHHWLNVKDGLAYSCNVFFYKLGEKLGVNNLARFAGLFGLGNKTGVELLGEKKGLVPSKKWKYLNKRKGWYIGETALFSIGQSYLLVTPLQIARAISVIANGGYLVKPTIIKRETGSGKREISKPETRKLDISLKNINIVRDGMVKAVQDENGTAYRLKIDKLSIAAKTGTAQVEGKEANSWIVGFCPVEHPEIVFVVFIEQGGLSARRVKIARELLEKWKEIRK